jgi:hypothetical protein
MAGVRGVESLGGTETRKSRNQIFGLPRRENVLFKRPEKKVGFGHNIEQIPAKRLKSPLLSPLIDQDLAQITPK